MKFTPSPSVEVLDDDAFDPFGDRMDMSDMPASSRERRAALAAQSRSGLETLAVSSMQGAAKGTVASVLIALAGFSIAQITGWMPASWLTPGTAVAFLALFGCLGLCSMLIFKGGSRMIDRAYAILAFAAGFSLVGIAPQAFFYGAGAPGMLGFGVGLFAGTAWQALTVTPRAAESDAALLNEDPSGAPSPN